MPLPANLPETGPNGNLYCVLRAGFPSDLDTLAIATDTGLHYSWRDLERSSAMMANLLQSLGLPPGARVAVQVEKSVEMVALYLATLRAGLVFLPLNPAYQSTEMAYFIGDATPAVLVCSPQNFSTFSKIAFVAGVQNVYTLDDNRAGSLLERARHCSDCQVPVHRTCDDTAAILYTSGTTGRSKGAMLSHGNLAENARVLQRYWHWQPDDVLLHALPLFHVHGLFVALHGALINGSPMRWLGRFDPAAVLALLPQATVFMGVPTLYVRLLAEPGLSAGACRAMRLFVSGSAPLLIDTFVQWQQRTGHTILERYGMTETAMLTSNPYAGERRAGTVGQPLPGVELQILGDAGEVLPTGAVGGIAVKGKSVCQGYWQMPEKTAEAFTSGGYFITGDVGSLDSQGYLTIAGRSKDLIISGGLNVYPAEIESVLNALPGVAESAVVGVPHPDFGEVGVALVVAKAGMELHPAALLTSLKTRLAPFKIPKRCVVVEALPRNAMGKVQKNVLRDAFSQTFASAKSKAL